MKKEKIKEALKYGCRMQKSYNDTYDKMSYQLQKHPKSLEKVDQDMFALKTLLALAREALKK